MSAVGANNEKPSEQTEATSTAAAAAKSAKEKKWFPLESNPDSLNKYVEKLGFNTSLYRFVDLFSTEDWAVSMIPQPVLGLVMLYPITPNQEEHREKESKEAHDDPSENVWYMKQNIGNACGTIGVLHAMANVPSSARESLIVSGSWLDRYYRDCPASTDPAIKAEKLEADTEIETMHEAATSSSDNQTSRGNLGDNVDGHFIALAQVDGTLYELDGRKNRPISHGATSNATFLTDACKVVEKFMKRDPGELRFTMLALSPNCAD